MQFSYQVVDVRLSRNDECNATTEHVEEWTQAASPAEIDEHLAKRDAASKKQAAQRETVIAEDMSEDSATVPGEYRPESRDG